MAPQLVTFDASESHRPDSRIREYQWHVPGDIIETDDPILEYPFDEPGEYDVEVRISTNDYGTVTASTTVTISEQSVDDYPTTGTQVPALSTFDRMMQDIMENGGMEGGTLGVMKDGDIVLERGYGWADHRQTEPMQPRTPMRIASVTKPITAAAIRRLADEGTIAYDDRVFQELELKPYGGEIGDERLLDITVQHLIHHRGGWDRDETFDPMFAFEEVAEAFNLDRPPEKREIARWMMANPLQFDPGEKDVYSNFGYCVLGIYIEHTTGKSYIDYITDAILQPIGADDIYVGNTVPENRPNREAAYFDPHLCDNVMKIRTTEYVPCPDGGFYLNPHDAVGGLVATPASLLRFMDSYWVGGDWIGRPREEPYVDGRTGFRGSLPGTRSSVYQHPDNVNAVIILNRRSPEWDETNYQDRMEQAIDQIDGPSWPNYS